MACRLVGTKPLSETNAGRLLIWPRGTKFCELIIHIFIQENPFEYIVCEMSAI